MNHKGTVSRREKSLVLNQAPILHEKWQTSGLDSRLIFLPTIVPEMFWGTHTTAAWSPSKGQGQTAHRSLGQLLPRAAQPPPPPCWGFPRHRWSEWNSGHIQNCSKACGTPASESDGTALSWFAPDCEGWLQVTALVRGLVLVSLKPTPAFFWTSLTCCCQGCSVEPL